VSELDMPAELARVAETIVKALASIAAATNPAVATQACDLLTRISTSFLLNNIGPTAAKNHLAAVWRDLDLEIQAANGGGNALQ
jgi:hypothetical protein